MKASYSGLISYETILEAEVDARFDDIKTAVDTDGFSNDQIDQRALRYRHIYEPIDLFLWVEKEGLSIFATQLDTGGVNWNVTNCKLYYQPSMGDAGNGQPIGVLHACFKSYRKEAGAYEIAFGYSTDGVTYTYLPFSSAFLGHTQADPNVPFTATVTHPISGAAGWWPYSAARKREVHITYAIKNITYLGVIDITAIVRWAVMIRVNEATYSNAGATPGNAYLSNCQCKFWIIGRDEF